MPDIYVKIQLSYGVLFVDKGAIKCVYEDIAFISSKGTVHLHIVIILFHKPDKSIVS